MEEDKFLVEMGKKIRNNRGYRYKNAIAADADISPSQLTRIEQGKVDIRIKTLGRIAKALGVQAADLVPSNFPE